MAEHPAGSKPIRGEAQIQRLGAREMAEAFLASREGFVAPTTMRTDRWALFLLADVYESLPTSLEALSDFMASQRRYLSGGGSMQRVWDTLRQLYAWARSQGYRVPAVPHIFYGRRRRGERRGRRRS